MLLFVCSNLFIHYTSLGQPRPNAQRAMLSTWLVREWPSLHPGSSGVFVYSWVEVLNMGCFNCVVMILCPLSRVVPLVRDEAVDRSVSIYLNRWVVLCCRWLSRVQYNCCTSSSISACPIVGQVCMKLYYAGIPITISISLNTLTVIRRKNIIEEDLKSISHSWICLSRVSSSFPVVLSLWWEAAKAAQTNSWVWYWLREIVFYSGLESNVPVLTRLSDYLFTLARRSAQLEGAEETVYKKSSS